MHPPNTASSLKTLKCIDKFTCICGSKYIGQIEQYLSDQMKKHSLKRLLHSRKKHAWKVTSKHCINADSALKVINKESNSQSLKFTEALPIRMYQPNLCIEKVMVGKLR